MADRATATPSIRWQEARHELACTTEKNRDSLLYGRYERYETGFCRFCSVHSGTYSKNRDSFTGSERPCPRTTDRPERLAPTGSGIPPAPLQMLHLHCCWAWGWVRLALWRGRCAVDFLSIKLKNNHHEHHRTHLRHLRIFQPIRHGGRGAMRKPGVLHHSSRRCRR